MTSGTDGVEEQARSGTGERAPTRRRRGQLRLRALVAATGALVAEHDVSEVGLYQIAERAGVPAASIYHFFPNKEAALVALAEAYLAEMAESIRVELASPPASWQELVALRVRAGAAYYNRNPALMKLFLGASISAEVRKRDMAGTLAMSAARAALLDRYFLMPPVPDWTGKVATSLALCDGIWALSYSQHRCISPESVEESSRAVIAYMRLYLPEWIEPRRVGTPT